MSSSRRVHDAYLLTKYRYFGADKDGNMPDPGSRGDREGPDANRPDEGPSGGLSGGLSLGGGVGMSSSPTCH